MDMPRDIPMMRGDGPLYEARSDLAPLAASKQFLKTMSKGDLVRYAAELETKNELLVKRVREMEGTR